MSNQSKFHACGTFLIRVSRWCISCHFLSFSTFPQNKFNFLSKSTFPKVFLFTHDVKGEEGRVGEVGRRRAERRKEKPRAEYNRLIVLIKYSSMMQTFFTIFFRKYCFNLSKKKKNAKSFF